MLPIACVRCCIGTLDPPYALFQRRQQCDQPHYVWSVAQGLNGFAVRTTAPELMAHGDNRRLRGARHKITGTFPASGHSSWVNQAEVVAGHVVTFSFSKNTAGAWCADYKGLRRGRR